MQELALNFLSKVGAVQENTELMLDKGIIDNLKVIISTLQSPLMTVAIQFIQVVCINKMQSA